MKINVDKTKAMRIKGERNILHEIKRKKANSIGRILRKKCILKHIIERKIGGGIRLTDKEGRKSKQLLMTLREGEDSLLETGR
jgi:hypothetical protein